METNVQEDESESEEESKKELEKEKETPVEKEKETPVEKEIELEKEKELEKKEKETLAENEKQRRIEVEKEKENQQEKEKEKPVEKLKESLMFSYEPLDEETLEEIFKQAEEATKAKEKYKMDNKKIGRTTRENGNDKKRNEIDFTTKLQSWNKPSYMQTCR